MPGNPNLPIHSLSPNVTKRRVNLNKKLFCKPTTVKGIPYPPLHTNGTYTYTMNVRPFELVTRQLQQ